MCIGNTQIQSQGKISVNLCTASVIGNTCNRLTFAGSKTVTISVLKLLSISTFLEPRTTAKATAKLSGFLSHAALGTSGRCCSYCCRQFTGPHLRRNKLRSRWPFPKRHHNTPRHGPFKRVASSPTAGWVSAYTVGASISLLAGTFCLNIHVVTRTLCLRKETFFTIITMHVTVVRAFFALLKNLPHFDTFYTGVGCCRGDDGRCRGDGGRYG